MTGKAEEAMDFYLSVFKNSKTGIKANYEEGQAENKNAKLMYADLMIEGYWIAMMDSNVDNEFAFNEATSLIVNCKDQAEIDYYWEKLSAVPESEQCGWLKDKYGVSWQIVPDSMNEMMEQGSPEQIARVTEAFLKMKKFDLQTLEEAYKNS
jgi:predicted 3-demethylubiquinone-9 3-methyltransferase (glyoxalase superfamily)